MTNELLIEKLSAAYPGAIVKQGFQYPELLIPREKLRLLMLALKSDGEMAFDYLFCQTGVDFQGFMQVVYHLESTKNNHFLVVKTNTENRETPSIDTVADIWPTAEFHEREIFDLLGIVFNSHPDLRRFFLDDSWGHPLRKDFKDEIHVVER